MNRWLTHNIELKLLALALAVGIVVVKAQEKIEQRVLRNVEVVVENVPTNMALPEEGSNPHVRLRVRGPKNTISFIQPDISQFRIDLAQVSFSGEESPIHVLLDEEMFRTNLEEDQWNTISIVEDSIQPRQVKFPVIPWELGEEKPDLPKPANRVNELVIPLYRLEKTLPIQVPMEGEPPSGIKINGYSVEPETVTLTGSRDVLNQVEAVNTLTLDLRGIQQNDFPIYLPLQNLRGQYNAWPVSDTIQDVTVVLDVEETS